MKENAQVIFAEKGVVELWDRDIPSPGKGELLIKTSKSLISTGTELTMLELKHIEKGSVWDKISEFPQQPGYSNAGVIVDVGEGVDKSWLGKKVATCGKHIRYFTLSADDKNLFEIPPDVDDSYAVFFSIARIVMNGVRRSNIKFGESAVIFGLGLLGQFAVRIVRLCGAMPVFGIDISDYRLSKLPNDCCIIPVNSKNEDIIETVKTHTKERMADLIYELTGNAALIPEEFNLLRNQGKFVLLSSPAGKTLFDFHDLCNAKSCNIIGAHSASHPRFETYDNPWTTRRHAELYWELIQKDQINISDLISHHAHYTNAVKFYSKLMEDRSKTLGVVLDWE